MKALRTLLILLTLMIAVVSVEAAEPQFLYAKIDLMWRTPLKLTEFGGPDIQVYVRARGIEHVTIETFDYTQQVAVPVKVRRLAGYDKKGRPQYLMDEKMEIQPIKKRTKIKRDKPVREPASGQDMYLLYEEAKSGMKVFFLEGIAPQNADMIVVGIPKKAEEKVVAPN